MKQEEKLKALDAALVKIEKDYGKGSVMKLGEYQADRTIEVTPTGSISLDIALGVGGVPKGRIIEIYGPESSGKTTVALHMVAEVQKRGGIAGFIDAEHALDPVYAKNIGVDIDNLYISQPDTGEQGLEITETMVRSGAIDIIIVDSVAALVPKAEIEGDMDDQQVGLHARPASVIAEAAADYDDEILLSVDGDEGIDASSVMLIMTLGAEKGTVVTVESENAEAVEKIAALIEADLDA